MKIGFPSVGKKSKIYQTEALNDPTDSYIKLSCETPHKPEEIVDKEFSRLDHELDSYEISNLNSLTKDFLPYKSYLQGLALALKKKNPSLSTKLLRGITGWEKQMPFFSHPSKKQRKNSIKTEKSLKSVETQTETIEETKDPIYTADVSKFLSLTKSVKRIKISRLTTKLKDIYDKLKVLDTEIPSGSNTPDMPEYELEDLTRFSPQYKMRIKDLEEVKIFNKLVRGKLMIEKEVQANLGGNGYLVMGGTIDAEMALVRKTRELEVALAENKKLMERIKKLSEGNEGYRKSDVKKTVVDEETEKILKSEVVDKRSFEIVKQKLEVLNSKYLKQQQKLCYLDSMLFNTKVLWKNAEEKLKQISLAWEKLTGSSFNFKPVSIEKIMEKIKENNKEDMMIIENAQKDLSDSYSAHAEVKIQEIGMKNNEVAEKEVDVKGVNKMRVRKKEEKELETDKGISSKKSAKKEEKHEEKKKRIKKIKHKDSKESSDSEEPVVKDTIKKINKSDKREETQESLQYFDSKFAKDLLRNSELDDHVTQSRSIALRPHHKKGKVNSMDSKIDNLEKSFETLKNDSVSKTQKQNLKKTVNFTSSQPPVLIHKSETPTYENTSKLKQTLKNFSTFPKSLESINPSNYQELLLKSLPADQALAIKRFIDSLLNKTTDKARYSNDKIWEIHEKKSEFSENPNQEVFHINEAIKYQMEKDERVFDFIDIDDKEKPKEMLRKVFSTEELRVLPQAVKVKINRLLIGHDLNCTDICEHLKRVMALKFKVFGIRYPMKTQLLKLITS